MNNSFLSGISQPKAFQKAKFRAHNRGVVVLNCGFYLWLLLLTIAANCMMYPLLRFLGWKVRIQAAILNSGLVVCPPKKQRPNWHGVPRDVWYSFWKIVCGVPMCYYFSKEKFEDHISITLLIFIAFIWMVAWFESPMTYFIWKKIHPTC